MIPRFCFDIIARIPVTPTETRHLVPGTTGWTARDLEDPQIAEEWFAGSYEIIEGVLATLAPSYFHAGASLLQIMFRITAEWLNPIGNFATGVEIVLCEDRVVRADAVFLTPADELRQTAIAKTINPSDPRQVRILIPPTLILESVSPCHDLHDRRIKRKWYAEFGVPNYWIVDAF